MPSLKTFEINCRPWPVEVQKFIQIGTGSKPVSEVMVAAWIPDAISPVRGTLFASEMRSPGCHLVDSGPAAKMTEVQKAQAATEEDEISGSMEMPCYTSVILEVSPGRHSHQTCNLSQAARSALNLYKSLSSVERDGGTPLFWMCNG
jgi:hypothetical protein